MAAPKGGNAGGAPAAPAKSLVDSVINTLMAAGNSLVSVMSGLLAAFLILYSGYVLYDTAYIQGQAFSSSWDLLQYRPEIIDDDNASLNSQMAALNPMYRCWLTVFDTAIDYPVLQGDDDVYFASRDFYGNTSLTGSIYLSAFNAPDLSDSYNIIYGHHMDNGAMFGGLDHFLEEAYRSGHQTGVIVTGSRVYDLQLFAVVETDAYDNAIYCPGDNMDSVLEAIAENNAYFDEAAVTGATKIVALSTCAGATTSGRLLVFFTMTERTLLELKAESWEGVFDGQPHSITVSVNIEADTVIEYSTDEGQTWSRTPPTRTDVGETKVLVRATNPYSQPVTAEATITVKPRPVTVRADYARKVYGTNDPEFSASVENLVEGYPIEYRVYRPGAGIDENVGSYPGAIVATGESTQGNYTITYVPAAFRITPAPAPALAVTGYEGVYDTQTHGLTVANTYPEGTVLEYSTDNGATWSRTAPAITNVGEISVLVRTNNPNYETAYVSAVLRVTPAPVTVTANNSGKYFGDPDPAGYAGATVTGVLDAFEIRYTLTRPRQGIDEAAGTYADAVVPTGDRLQGNYEVSFVPGDFTIAPKGTLNLVVTGFLGFYDTHPHGVTVMTDLLPEGTTLEYSTDGGKTWSTTPPTRTVVGVTNVTVRATNPNYGTAEASATIHVLRAAVVVTAHNSAKAYGEEDPEGYSGVTVTGVIDDFVIQYTLSRPGEGTEENAGFYDDALLVTGEDLQGNYFVRYILGDFTIYPAPAPVLNATGYTGVYDAQPHTLNVDASGLPAGTTVEYSTDGVNWTTEMPTITDVGSVTVQIRATNPNYETVSTTVILRVTPKQVTVIADPASKSYGDPDPEFTARVEGVIDDFEVRFTVYRENADSNEAVGTYALAIVPTGETVQGNYTVSYVAADFRIVRTLPVPSSDEPPEDDVPLENLTARFVPAGNRNGRAWALVNLISLILTIYLFLPLFDLRPKFRRRKMLKTYEEDMTAVRESLAAEGLLSTELDSGFRTTVENLLEAVKKFVRRFRIGLVLELIISVAALILFILTEDMRAPMILIDRWTPLMLLLLLLCWLSDVFLVRFRTKEMNEQILDTLSSGETDTDVTEETK